MKSLHDTIKQLNQDNVLCDTITAFLSAEPQSMPGFISAAIEHGPPSGASALFDHVPKNHPDYLEIGLRVIRALSDAGETDPALRHLAGINRDRPGEPALIEAMQHYLMRAANHCNDYLIAGELEPALNLSNLIVDLWPHVAIFRNKRDELRLNLEFRTLQAQAESHAKARDFELELKYRLILFDHPWRERQIGILQLQNIVIALSRLLRADLDTIPRDRILAAQRLLAAVPSVPPLVITGNNADERAAARFERFYRKFLGLIDLDVVFGEPTPVEPPWPLTYAGSDGRPLLPRDVIQRCEQIGGKIAFMTSTSKEYFARYAQTYISSILQNSDCQCIIFVCICVPNADLAGVITHNTIQDPRLIFCSDGFDCDSRPIQIHDPGRDEPHKNPGIYYASSGLLHADTVMRLLNIPVICTGIDTVLQSGVRDFLEEFSGYDMILNQSGVEFYLGSQVINNLIILNPTYNSFIFIDFLRKYLGFHLLQEEQSTFLDQLDLHMAKHYLMKNGSSPKLGYFGTFDINNVMFERSHLETHAELVKQFRFLNLFVGGGTANPLTPDDVITK